MNLNRKQFIQTASATFLALIAGKDVSAYGSEAVRGRAKIEVSSGYREDPQFLKGLKNYLLFPDSNRIAVYLPPRFLKTTLAVWYAKQFEGRKVLYVTSSGKHSDRIQRKFSQNSNVSCRAYNGSYSGDYADIAVIDTSYCESATGPYWEELSSHILTRIHPYGKMLYVTTLLPGDGTSAQLKEWGFQEPIRLAAINNIPVEEAEARRFHKQASDSGISPGCLFPEAFPPSRLEEIKRILSESQWRSMYLCQDM